MCHEVAHELTPGDAHTEDWVSTHLYLLHTNLNIPMKQLVSTIEAYKIKYNQSIIKKDRKRKRNIKVKDIELLSRGVLIWKLP